MRNLDGKIAIVTGSDSGIGQAIAITLAEAGARVAVVYHTDHQGGQATLEAVREVGSDGVLVQVDVREESSVTALFRQVSDELGVPDILVNNAGIDVSSSITELSFDDFDNVIKTNLYGPFLGCREFCKARKNSGTVGKIVNITSVHDAIPSPEHLPYGASKGAVLSMTKSLALELAPLKVNVNAIAPGQIYTPMTKERIEDSQERRQEWPNIPWGRAGSAKEVAALALYLVSSESDYVTGQSFTIDGGLEMNWGQGA